GLRRGGGAMGWSSAQARRWAAKAVVLTLLVGTSTGLGVLADMHTAGAAIFNYTHPTINNPEGITAGPDGALWFADRNNDSIGRITTSGTVTNFTDVTISCPQNIVTGSDGALWFTNPCNDSIGRITTGGAVSNFTDPGIHEPWAITAGPDGALWFTTISASRI